MTNSHSNLELERRGPAYAKALRRRLGQEFSDVRKVAAALGLEIREVDAAGFDGALIRAQNYPIGTIVVRSSIREAGQKNFTIGHEIGHFVLPGHDGASLTCTSSEVAPWEDAPSSKDSEREADEFATELLMPEDLVRNVIGSSTPSLPLIERIARKTGASLSAAAWRYCDLTSERCAIVWSTDGIQNWATRSNGFAFFLPNGRKIQAGSFAAACIDAEKVPLKPREVAMSFWVDGPDIHPSRIWEQSKALPAYRSIISLLWIKDSDTGSKG